MIDVEIELSSLFLALRLTKQVDLCRQDGDDEFTIFRKFAGIIREYENEKGEKSNK